MDFPYEIKEVEENLGNQVTAVFHKRKNPFLQVGPKKYFMYSKYRNEAAGYYNMELRPDDVWVITFPRSGTTWTQELVWLLNNDLDYERALKEKLIDRFPLLELSVLSRNEILDNLKEKSKSDPERQKELEKLFSPGYEMASRLKSPRHFKSHMPLSLLPPKLLDTCKVIYVARNPKDVAVSYFHFNKLQRDFDDDVTFEKYWDLFQKGLIHWSPYWSHVEEAWQARNHKNMQLIFYEEMKQDLPGVIRKVAEFLGKTITKDQVEKLVNHSNIDNFRTNPSLKKLVHDTKDGKDGSSAGFYRKGVIGGWRSEFSQELNEVADEWIRENEAKTGINFQYK
ncbi:sulfotransferase 1C4-like isoform X1 [Ischnura elegans]|uniref:sulfotransferase 1C4-like isoform X1 n=1 Tax=Ischnura elegans TaxID=197161 RepID=UPI001ED87B4B|nr:sulfotransferase 1C4-like isoform X1 [Ischnura elegans]